MLGSVYLDGFAQQEEEASWSYKPEWLFLAVSSQPSVVTQALWAMSVFCTDIL